MVLDQKLLNIMHNADKKCVSIEYFVKDDRKADWKRPEHVSGYIRNVDVYGKKIVMEDRTEIPIDDIYDLDIDQNRMYICMNREIVIAHRGRELRLMRILC